MENKIREGERAQTEFEKISKRIDEKISELYKTLEPVIISTIQDKNKEILIDTEIQRTMLSIEDRLIGLCSSIKI